MTTISIDDVVIGESDGFAEFTVRLDQASADLISVNWASDPISAGYSDFTDLAGTLTFNPGETVKTFRIAITNDALVEARELFAVYLTQPTNATIAKDTGFGTIIDNDAASGTPLVTIADFSVDEASGEASFVIILNRPSTSTVTMNWATVNGTALAGSDYVGANGTLSFAPGQVTKTVKISLLNDILAEGAEAFSLRLTNLVNATSLDPVGTATIGANDSTAVAVPNISISDGTVSEADGYIEFVVRLDAPGINPVTVRWASDTVTAGYSDFNDLAGTLTFAAGETLKIIRIPVVNDTIVEVSEIFVVELYSATDANISKSVGTATIIDNDAATGTPVVSISDLIIDEASGEAVFVITLSRPSGSTVSMNYGTINGTAIAGSDYIGTSGSVSFAAGETVKIVKVGILNDSVAEGSESFTMRLSALVNATTLDQDGTGVIYANDATAVAVPAISVDDVVVGEKDGFVEFVVRLDAPGSDPVTVYWASDTRTAGYSDFTDLSGYLTFAAGEMVKTVRIPITNDTLAEVAETFVLQLYSPVNATIAKNIGTATIIDNDAASGTPVVSISDLIIDEATGEASFVITLDRPSTSTVAMNYGTVNGTAIAGSDYIAKSGVIRFGAGETSKTIKIGIINDSVAEGSESFTLRLSGLVNATTLDQDGTGVIHANDSTPVAIPNMSVDDVTVGEKDGFVEFVVRLDAPGSNPVTVYWASDTLTAGYSDFTDSGGYLTFAAGETVKTIRIPLTNDTLAEVREFFVLELYSPTNATIVKDIGVATIIDNDAASGTPVVSISDLVIDEASGEASFVITLDRPSTSTVSMNYGTINGTAIAGSDYIAKSGSISFAAGETSKTIKVGIINDSVTEGLEKFTLRLSGLVNATTLDADGTGTIGANDKTAVAVPKITIDDILVGEKDGFAEFVVRLDAPGINTVKVYWASDTLTAGYGDFTDVSGYLTFAPGEMLKTIRIPITDDMTVETVESFEVTLYSPTGATISKDFGTAFIVDNDAPSGTPTVFVSDPIIDEAVGEVSFTITLERPSTSVVSMSYTTADISGIAGSDYVPVSGIISFAPGETAKTIKVGINNDGVAEGLEAIGLRVSGVSNAIVVDPIGIATIYDNDAAAVSTPSISISDVTVVEGGAYAAFTVQLDAPGINPVTVRWASDTATAGYSDFVDVSGTLIFLPGEMVRTVLVPIVNDTTVEAIESLTVELFSAVGATIGKDVGVATIIDNDGGAIPTVTINGTVGDDVLRGTAFPDIINGDDGNDVLVGSFGADQLNGGAGNDVLDGGAAADTMNGGLGNDIYLVEDGGDVVNEAVGAGTDHVFTGLATYALTANIERLTGVSAIGQTLTGNGLANVITGGTGHDTINGASGADSMIGGLGNDTYVVDNVGDSVVEAVDGGIDGVRTALASYMLGANVENLTGTRSSSQTLHGNALANIIVGSTANDTLNGGAGNDTLNGAAGADRMTGGVGNDIYIVDNAGDVVVEATSGGTDEVRTVLASYALGANVENLTASGAGNKVLNGNGLANVIKGGVGNDTINGGAGPDILTGGTGMDTFRFTTTPGGTNVDQITDFAVADDTIRLSATTFAAAGPVGILNANAFVIGTAAADASDRIIYDSSTGTLFYDADGVGAGAAVAFAQLGAGLALTNADFVVG